MARAGSLNATLGIVMQPANDLLEVGTSVLFQTDDLGIEQCRTRPETLIRIGQFRELMSNVALVATVNRYAPFIERD